MHGISGLDTQSSNVDHIKQIALIQKQAGITSFVLSLYPGPIGKMRESLEAIKKVMDMEASESNQHRHSFTQMESARILGVHLEGPYLNPTSAGALDRNAFINPDEKSFRTLIEGYEKEILTITIAPELGGAAKLTQMATAMGIIVNMGHSNATWTEAENCHKAGAKGITHLFNAMRIFHHREPGIVGFGLLNSDVYVEIIGDMYHLSPQVIQLVFRLKHEERILLISDSVAQTELSGTTAPRGVKGELLGGAMSLAGSVQKLLDEGFDRDRVIMSATINPERYLENRF
jgi:N-acetylglucosamine-6-phosphate deacetylase